MEVDLHIMVYGIDTIWWNSLSSSAAKVTKLWIALVERRAEDSGNLPEGVGHVGTILYDMMAIKMMTFEKEYIRQKCSWLLVHKYIIILLFNIMLCSASGNDIDILFRSGFRKRLLINYNAIPACLR